MFSKKIKYYPPMTGRARVSGKSITYAKDEYFEALLEKREYAACENCNRLTRREAGICMNCNGKKVLKKVFVQPVVLFGEKIVEEFENKLVEKKPVIINSINKRYSIGICYTCKKVYNRKNGQLTNCEDCEKNNRSIFLKKQIIREKECAAELLKRVEQNNKRIEKFEKELLFIQKDGIL